MLWRRGRAVSEAPRNNNTLHGDFNDQLVTITQGRGVYVYDEAGKRYLDAASGVGVVNIGHAVPEIVAAIARQAKELAFSYGSLVTNGPREVLAALLDGLVPMGMRQTKTLFSSGGAEANEAA